MFDDLDEVRGGFRWWYGQMDQPKVIFAGDYLLQITAQINTWLTLAARHEINFNQAWYAETSWLRLNEGKGTYDQPFPPRGESEQRRDQQIDAAIIGFFHACGSVLDALAGVGIGVLSLRTDLVTASWSNLHTAASGEEKKRNKMLAATGTEARGIQEDALAAIMHAVSQGPHGWLSWTLSMRNALVHRAHRLEMRRFYRLGPRKQVEYALHLAKDPQLTDAEAFVLGDTHEDLLLWEHAGTTMAGVLDQLLVVVSTAASRLHDVWKHRRAQPNAIPQAGEQWRDLYPTRRDLSGFSGFGARLPSPADGEELRVSSDAARRLRAARVFDSDRPYWWTAFAKGD